MTTAFQIGAFQFTGFQEALPTSGSGDWILHWLNYARRLDAERKAKRKREEEERELDVALPAMVELSFRAVAPTPVARPLIKLSASREYKDALELAEFNDVMALIFELEEA